MQAHRLALQLTKMGIRVEVLTGTDNAELVGKSVVDGISVIRVLRNKSSRFSHLKFGWNIFRFIAKNKSRYDLLHSHGFHAPVNLASMFTGIPLVQKITNLNVDDPLTIRGRRYGFFRLNLFQNARAIIATSQLLEDTCNFVLRGKNDTIRIPNGVNTQEFRPATQQQKTCLREKLLLPQDKIVLLTVGTVSYIKGLDRLLKALNKLQERIDKKFMLVVLGPLETRQAFRRTDPKVDFYVENMHEMISAFGLQQAVRFEGNRSNVHEYMKAADLFIHPSRQEGQPNALLEAMACGLTSVAHLIPGITDEIIQNGKFGFIVDCDDTESFAAALKVLINNPRLRSRIAENARREIRSKYDIKTVAESYFNLYQKILLS